MVVNDRYRYLVSVSADTCKFFGIGIGIGIGFLVSVVWPILKKSKWLRLGNN